MEGRSEFRSNTLFNCDYETNTFAFPGTANSTINVTVQLTYTDKKYLKSP